MLTFAREGVAGSLRETLAWFVREFMEAEVAGQIGAGLNEKTSANGDGSSASGETSPWMLARITCAAACRASVLA